MFVFQDEDVAAEGRDGIGLARRDGRHLMRSALRVDPIQSDRTVGRVGHCQRRSQPQNAAGIAGLAQPLAIAQQNIVAAAAIERVGALPADQIIQPRAAIDQIIADAARNRIIAIVAVQRIRACAAIQVIIAIIAAEGVVARKARDAVIPSGARQRVIARGCNGHVSAARWMRLAQGQIGR